VVSIWTVDTNTVWSQGANQLWHKADHSPPPSKGKGHPATGQGGPRGSG